MAEYSGAALAATWRDRDDQVIATTDGSTVCWFPRAPNTMRIEREDYEHIVRCRECPGCIELDRRRLADRLVCKYGRASSRLYLVRIYSPASRHSSISRKLHRRPRLELEPGFWRLGATSLAVIARSGSPVREAVQAAGLDCRIETLKLRRGRRAWRAITSGLTVTRDVYGEQVKRWYCRGLPAFAGERWEVNSHAGQRGYARTTSPRAWSAGNVVLVPPEIWRLGRADRRDLRAKLARAASPEAVQAVVELAKAFGAASRLQSSSNQPREARPDTVQMTRRALIIDQAKKLSSTTDSDLRSSPPASWAGGYPSSGHSTIDGRARDGPADADPPTWFDERTRRDRIIALQGRPWDELTIEEQGEVRAWLAERELARPTAAVEREQREKKRLASQLESLRRKIFGDKSDG